MIPNRANRAVTSSGVAATGVFGVSEKDQAHILQILRDRLYTNKILAVLREYGSNAWDEHRDAGIPDRPIKIALPTQLSPTLVIRDYGRGLSEDDIFNVYVKYGASTKRDSDVAVGMLGIGAKSAFAYSDTFSITSYHNGTKSIYVAVLDESDVGVCNKLHEEPCVNGESGVEIKVQVNPKDIYQFQKEAAALYPFFNPQPKINLKLPPVKMNSNSAGFLVTEQVEGLPQWVAVMGCVPYRINFTSVQEEIRQRGLYSFMEKARGGLLFDIGDVDVSANREELEYTDDTKAGIVERLEDLRAEVIQDIAKAADDPSLSFWERRVRIRTLLSAKGLGSIGAQDKGYGVGEVTLVPADPKKAPQEFRLRYLKEPGYREKKWSLEATRSIPVASNTRILIRDQEKNSRGYYESKNDVFVVALHSADAAEQELLDLLKEKELTGVPVHRISQLTYVPFSVNRGSSVHNSKYSQRTFTLLSQKWTVDPYRHHYSQSSQDWEKAAVPLQKDDVYVILEKFKPVDWSFFASMRGLQSLSKFFDEPLPDFYGLRSTASKPVDPADVDAMPFKEWRDEYLDDLLRNPLAKELTDAQSWTHGVSNSGSPEKVVKALGADHIVSKFLKDDAKYRGLISSDVEVDLLVTRLREKNEETKSASYESTGRLDVIQSQYPLLRERPGSLLHLTEGLHSDAWIEYIRTMDGEKKK